jgi:thiol-disulfide isomerase/thioredoxin
VAGLAFACSGCQKAGPPASTADTAEKKGGDENARESAPLVGPPTARAVLEKMVAAYRKASSYQDLGTVRMMVQMTGAESKDDKIDFSVVMVRPNKLQMKVDAAKIVCDGKQFRATIDDLPGQVLTKEAPAKLTMPVFYGDGILANALSQGPAGAPVQLMLLFGEDPLKGILADAEEPVLAEPGKIADRDCYRVKLTRPEGTLVFWIDRETFVLRRMLPPTDSLRQHLEANGGKVESLSVVAEFTDARLGGDVDAKLFSFDLPKEAQAVKYFLPPTAWLLGKKVPDFKFTGLDDKPVTPESLAGKVVVLDFWATYCQPCRESLPNLEKVYQKYKDNDKVAFVAVSLDEAKTDNKTVQEAFDTMKIHVPIVRDPAQSARVFHFEVIPTTFLLGADGTVQDYEEGVNPNLTTELPAKIEKLLAGDDLSNAWLKRYEGEQKQYQQMIESQGKGGGAGESGVKEVPIPKADIAPKSEPKHLKLTSLWKCQDLKSPGNILVVPQPNGPPRLAVIDSWNSIVEVGLDGKVIATHKLDIQQKEVLCNLRTAVGGDGKRRFVAFASAQQRLHLLDENWKLLIHYPEDALTNPHSGIADVELADLEGNGTLRLYVGYWGIVGVQAASLAGEKLESDRTINNVIRMAIGPAKKGDEKGHRDLICTNSSGSLVMLNAKLQHVAEVSVPQRMLHWIVGEDLKGDGQLQWCGLTARRLGENVAIGINLKGEELWTYALPDGVQPQPIEPIIAGKVTAGDGGQWLLPGPDGSIHIVDADGKLLDRFNYGAPLAGLATVEIDGKPVLIVATAAGLEAWRVQ